MTTPEPPVYNARYELREQIGRGGTAQVYLARDLLLGRPVALKVLMSELSRDHSFVERFRREAQAAANLTHPNIVSVFDWGESDETYFIVMEHIDGESLASIIRTQAPLRPAQAASIGADIANALAYAHRHGVVHRDVKPGNVLITADGQVKVTDFGIARAVGTDDQITQTGLVMGTATYFSPEQAQGFEVDGRSDVYSLGVVLYEMVVGRPPFHGENPVSIAYQHVREEPPTPRSINPSVPLALEAIILEAMAKLPEQRYATAEELRADLGRFVHGQAVLARPPSGATGEVTRALSTAPGTDATVAAPVAAVPVDPSGGVPVRPVDEGPRRTTKWWALAGTALAVGIALIVVFVGRDLGYFGGGSFVKVPTLVSTQKARAVSLLRERGLVAHLMGRIGNGTNTGEVFDQDPRAGESVRKGSHIDVHFYSPPGSAPLPDVRGETASLAKKKLTAAGFVPVVTEVPATTPDQQQGTVVDEHPEPEPGRSEQRHSTVTIKVIKGTTAVKVPNIVGDTPLQAGVALGGVGLQAGTQQLGGYSATVAAGDIAATDPPVGTAVAPNQAIVLKISRGPGVVIPSVVNLTVSTAEQELASAGLTSTPVTNCASSSTPEQANLVVSQAPMYVANRMVSPSHPVILYVGCAPGTSTPTGSTPTGSTPTGSTPPSSAPPAT